MKKVYLLFASVLLLTGSGCSDDDPMPAPSIPTITDRFDPLFAQELQKRGYIADAARITAEEVNQITKLDVSGKSGAVGALTSLKGLACFEALKELDCGYNLLTELDLSANAALTVVRCGSNGLSSLDVSKNTALTHLTCSDNKLTALNVNDNPSLSILRCDRNGLIALDIIGNTALETLDCASNPGAEDQFTVSAWFGNNDIPDGFTTGSWELNGRKVTIDYRKMDPAFTEKFDPLFAQELQKRGYIADASRIEADEVKAITRLDLSGEHNTPVELTSLRGIEWFESLEELYCNYTLLTSLDVSKNKALKILECSNNSLQSLNVSGNAELTKLKCPNNRLTALDVSGCVALEQMEFGSNEITALDLKNNPALVMIRCVSNKIRSLDLSNNPHLRIVNIGSNVVARFDVSKCTELEQLQCYENHLVSLDLSNNTKLTGLWCSDNPGQDGLFIVNAWFDNDHIPENFTTGSWESFYRTVKIDYRKVEPSNP